jgi:TolB-like protein/tetratricopeptide (TPR) repeat protein
MTKLLSELKERRIWRVLVAYPSVTFVLLQAIEFFINNYGLDGRFLTATLVAATALLPAAFVWNWRHGEAGKQDISRPELSAYAVFGVAAIAAVAWYWSSAPADPRTIARDLGPVRSVAVMPFVNASSDANMQYLCDGIAESLTNWLATVQGIKAISKSAAFRLRDQTDDTATLRSQLGADSVIRGRLEKVGDQIVISASLVDTRDESQLWGERLIRPIAEVIYLERSIVSAIKDGLRLDISGSSPSHAASGGTDQPEAYQHYLRGHFLIQATNLESIAQGLDELRAAIQIDPRFALPYADIGDALSQMIFYGIYEGEELLGEARSAAFSAVALAPDLAEAHTALAAVHQYITMDWKAADAAYDTAIALSPQSPVPYHRYADFLWITVRNDHAREMAKRAIEIDPLDGSSMHAVGITALMAGDFKAAAAAFGEWNQFHPGSRWSYVKHAVALAMDGQCELSEQQAEAADKLRERPPSALMESWIAWTHHACKREDQYQRSKERIEAAIAQKPQRLDPGYFYFYALEGDADSTLDFIQRAIDTKSSLTFFVQLPLLDHMGWPVTPKLASNQTYRDLLRDLNFPPTKWSVN